MALASDDKGNQKVWGITPDRILERYTLDHMSGRLRDHTEGRRAGVTQPTWKARKAASRRRNKQARFSRKGNR